MFGWLLREEWVTASNNLTVVTLGLYMLTQFLAQKCGILEWLMLGWLLRAECVTAVKFLQWLV